MFKAAYNLVGCTITDTPALGNVMQVNDQTWAYLFGLLQPGDWTYIIAGAAPNAEVIKVIGVSANLLEVVRGFDNTTPIAHPANTDLFFVMSPSAVLDVLTANPVEISGVSITGEYPITVTQETTNNFKVTIDPLSLTGDDTIDVTGEYPNLQIGVKRSANGCCT